MSESTMSILKIAIELVCTVIAVLVIPYIKNKIGAQKMESIEAWVTRAVSAAEILFPDVKSGSQKKAYVLEFLDKLNIKISEAELDILIESAVKSLKLEQKKADGGEAK